MNTPDDPVPSRPHPDRTEDRNWHDLTTEARHPESTELDILPTEQIVSLLAEEDSRGTRTVSIHRAAIARAAEWIAEALAGGGSVVFAGAGTSGRLGMLEAAECPPTFGTDPQQIRAVMAGGQAAIFRAQEGAEDRAGDGREAVADLESGDLLIGLSASGVTPFVRGALDEARNRGVRTVLLTCTDDQGLDDAAELVVALATGPEILAGSTRLKAGSATKAALNAMTTSAMVRLGKVYQNLMVDLRPGSAKLRDRSLRIISVAGQVSRRRAEELYVAAGGQVKTAIVMARLEVTAAAARCSLQATGGNVREALAEASRRDSLDGEA